LFSSFFISQSRAPRLRYRVTGARGGRVLHTPTGLVPSELTKKAVLARAVAAAAAAAAATSAGAQQREDEYDEEEY
jgi:hypothetical protein